VALPFLEEYFGLLARATPVPLDIEATARAELEWWQARREAIAPQTYGAMIARVSTLLYGRDSEKLREAGVLRAEAMATRDARDEAIVDADWSAIEMRLTEAYEILKREVSNRLPGTLAQCELHGRSWQWRLIRMFSFGRSHRWGDP
jgi:hypothetical protein